MKRFSIVLMAALLGATSVAHAETRNHESIERTFDRNKGKIYAEYARALRANPGLKGKLVLQLDIGTSGAVTNCRVKSSELNDEALEAAICSRIRSLQFEPGRAPSSIVKPIDFYPAA